MNKKSPGLSVMFQSLLYITISNMIVTSYSPMDKMIKDHFAISATMVGLLTSMAYIGLIAISPFVGFFVDHLGSFKAIKIGMFIMALGATVVSTSSVFPQFMAGYFLIGLGFGIMTPATNNAVMKTYYPHHATPMGVKQAGLSIGGALTIIILPIIFIDFDFYAPFIFLAIMAFILAIVTKSEPKGKSGSVDLKSYFRELKGTIHNRRFLVTNGLMAVMYWSQMSILTFSVLFAVSIGYGLFQAESLLVTILIGSFFGRVFWSWLSSRILLGSRAYSLSMVMIISSAMFIVFSLQSHNFPLSVAIFFFLGFTAIGWNGVYITVISEIAPMKLIGMYSAMGLLIISIGAIIGSPLSGAIDDLTGSYAHIWQVLAIAVFISAIMLAIYSRHVVRNKNKTRVPASS